MVRNILSPVLGRQPEDLEALLLFGSVDHCKSKIDAFRNVFIFGRYMTLTSKSKY
jgi:hypothetical protein